MPGIYLSIIAPITIRPFSRLPCSSIISIITGLRAETTASRQNCGIGFSVRCFDEAKLDRIMRVKVTSTTRSLDAQCVRIAPNKWIWIRRATFGNKATNFGTSFGRK
jgi:hypothetical protein